MKDDKSSAFLTVEELADPNSKFNLDARLSWEAKQAKRLREWGEEVTPCGLTNAQILLDTIG